ncbi:hypothetical protein ACJX0J_038087, partial [Zea mays]
HHLRIAFGLSLAIAHADVSFCMAGHVTLSQLLGVNISPTCTFAVKIIMDILQRYYINDFLFLYGLPYISKDGLAVILSHFQYYQYYDKGTYSKIFNKKTTLGA